MYVGKFIQLHVAANKSLKIVEMGDVKLVAITSSIPTTFNGGIKRYKGVTYVRNTASVNQIITIKTNNLIIKCLKHYLK